jgi:predicted GIY-YIG superfamily endonuclease
MGATVNKLVTRLDNLDNKGLWEAAMVVVLLSRTKLAKDLIFIGDARRTVNTLWNALLAGGKYNEITQYVLDCLIAKQSQSDHVLKLPYIRKMFSQLPTLLPGKGNYVVYLLVSTKDPESTYVGYTGNIRKRLNKHNSYNGGSYGTGIDHSNLAPFGLLAMIVGFTEKSHARSFEQTWKNHIDFKRRSTKGKVSSMTLMNLANPLIKDIEKVQSLHLVQCGYVKEQNLI